MKKILFLNWALLGYAAAATYTISPTTQEVEPGSLVVLTATEASNWVSNGGTLGSNQGSRVVLEAPKEGGTITVNAQSVTDPQRRAIAVVTVKGNAVSTSSDLWHMRPFAAGNGVSYAIDTNGTLWGWGRNEQQQIGANAGRTALIPTQINDVDGAKYVTATKAIHSTRAVILDETQELWVLPGVDSISSNVDFVSAATDVFAVTKDGKAVWLSNRSANPYIEGTNYEFYPGRELAKMSDGSWKSQSTPLNLPILQAPLGVCQVQTDRDAYIGSSEKYIVIDRSRQGYSLDPYNSLVRKLSGFKDVDKIDCYDGWGLFKNTLGEVYAFNAYTNGQVSNPQIVKGATSIVDISVSSTHALLLRQDGTLLSYSRTGENKFGELGNGKTGRVSGSVEVLGIKVNLY